LPKTIKSSCRINTKWFRSKQISPYPIHRTFLIQASKEKKSRWAGKTETSACPKCERLKVAESSSSLPIKKHQENWKENLPLLQRAKK